MKIEIWSDIVCPFCYIGKRKFEAALAQFEHKTQVQIEWKSFQLTPDLKTDPKTNSNEFLAKHKNITLDHAKKMHAFVTKMAADVGLKYDFDKVVIANSFNAHRFLHFAKSFQKQNVAKELLFKSYFVDGKNIDSVETLDQIAKELKLDYSQFKSDSFHNEVLIDIEESNALRIDGVPFFVFNRKFSISGAQDSSVFLEALQKTYTQN